MTENETIDTDEPVKKEDDVSLVKKLFDGENDENIVLFDDDGDETVFEQIATITHEGEIYAVLHPVDAPEEEVLVFKIDTEDEESVTIVEDEELANKILEVVVKSEEKLDCEND